MPNTTVDPKPAIDEEQGENDEFAKNAKLPHRLPLYLRRLLLRLLQTMPPYLARRML